MDHRAIEEANFINRTGHSVLDYVGSTVSPEMEIPKILWIKRNLNESFKKAARFFDLVDFLTYKATGIDGKKL